MQSAPCARVPRALHTIAMADTFSLGPAILRARDSPGHAPDAWLSALLQKHLNSPGRITLSQTSKPALQLLLKEAPAATLTVSVHGAIDEPAHRFLQRMQRATAQLLLRGANHTTTLSLQQCSIQLGRGDTWWDIAFPALRGMDTSNATISLSFQHMPRQLFTAAGQALQGLTSLSIGTLSDGPGTIQLPPPSALPALRHLTVHRVCVSAQAGLWASVRPYLQQLVSLSISEQLLAAVEVPTKHALWRTVFRGTAPSRSLQRLTVPEMLSADLHTLVTQHAPHIQELTVREFAYLDEPTVPCNALRLSNEGCIRARAWSELPQAASGKLCIEMVPRRCGVDLGIAELSGGEEKGHIYIGLKNIALVAEKLTHIEFRGHAAVSVSAYGIPPDAQPSALRAALPLIAPLHTPTVQLVLTNFTLTQALAAEITAVTAAGWEKPSLQRLIWPTDLSLPVPLPPLHTRIPNRPLDDAFFPQLVQSVSSLEQLGVWGVRLSVAHTNASARVPWRCVGLQRVPGVCGIRNWLQQAERVGPGVTWTVDSLHISLTLEEVSAGEHHTLAAQLNRVLVTSIENVYLTMPPDTSITDQPRLLRASLIIARALPCTPRMLHISGWVASDAVVSELAGLPHWQDITMALTSYMGMLAIDQPWPVARLPLLLPKSYRKWYIDDGLLPRELRALVLNMPVDRTAAEPLSVLFDRDASDAVGAFNRQMTHPHVRVEAFNNHI